MGVSNDCLRFFASFIESETGIIYTEVNYYQLESRLEDIAKKIGLAGAEGLWEKARNEGITGQLRQLLIDVSTNNETSFFRDINVFNAVRTLFTKSVKYNFPDKPYKIWSCACSTGQELYSLAILLAEIREMQPFYYNIIATDISDRVLARAREGIYSQLEVQRGLTDLHLKKFFNYDSSVMASESMAGASWAVRQDLKNHLKFQKLNLLESWRGLESYNLILCRNVLIYQNIESKKKIIRKLFEHLLPGGYLILGGAESLIGLFDELEYVTMEGAVLYHKKDTEIDARFTG